MSFNFYVPAEQQVRDKAEFARKGIARGRSIAALEYDNGVLLLAENPSTALRKISEVYDRIAFAGVGRYNEFEMLRKAGIRQADLMGYLYSRDDVTAQAVATGFAEALGAIFSREQKPYEVEVLVAEVGTPNRLYRVSYDGTLYDERQVAAIGGKADVLVENLRQGWTEGMTLDAALAHGQAAFAAAEGRTLEGWEAAVLDRENGRRAFRRLQMPAS
ncbi:MAG TPA: proteasome subunit alpha [Acidimicrobiia bacterium]|jgi:proteasome alpha subunit|nr:proteasome subunit alpha [Acidimicrobiia bacterium]